MSRGLDAYDDYTRQPPSYCYSPPRLSAAELERRRQQVAKQEKDISQLTAKAQTQGKELRELTTQNSVLGQQVTRARQENAGQKAQYEQLRRETDKLKSAVETVTKSCTTLTTRQASEEKKQTQLTDTVRRLETQNAQLEQQRVQLEATAQGLRADNLSVVLLSNVRALGTGITYLDTGDPARNTDVTLAQCFAARTILDQAKRERCQNMPDILNEILTVLVAATIHVTRDPRPECVRTLCGHFATVYELVADDDVKAQAGRQMVMLYRQQIDGMINQQANIPGGRAPRFLTAQPLSLEDSSLEPLQKGLAQANSPTDLARCVDEFCSQTKMSKPCQALVAALAPIRAELTQYTAAAAAPAPDSK